MAPQDAGPVHACQRVVPGPPGGPFLVWGYDHAERVEKFKDEGLSDEALVVLSAERCDNPETRSSGRRRKANGQVLAAYRRLMDKWTTAQAWLLAFSSKVNPSRVACLGLIKDCRLRLLHLAAMPRGPRCQPLRCAHCQNFSQSPPWRRSRRTSHSGQDACSFALLFFLRFVAYASDVGICGGESSVF